MHRGVSVVVFWTIICVPSGCSLHPAKRSVPVVQTQPASQVPGSNPELDAVKAHNRILAARLVELTDREKRLVKELNRLRFLHVQQQQQIQALADAPAERDALKKRCDALSAEVSRLVERLARLQAEPPDANDPASAPHTRPVSP